MPVDGTGTSIADWISVVVAAGALIVAIIAFSHTRAVARTQTFLEFRKRFLDIKTTLPNWFAEDDMTKWPLYDSASEDWQNIERYWQNAFDEWFITMRVDKRVLGRLWWLFYREAIRSGLKHKTLRFAAAKLTHGNIEFGGYGDDFRQILNDLWRESESHASGTVCEGFNCSVCNPTRVSASVKPQVENQL